MVLISKKNDLDERRLYEKNKYNIKFINLDSSMSNFIALRQKLREKKEYESADNMRKDIESIVIIIEDWIESGWRWSDS